MIRSEWEILGAQIEQEIGASVDAVLITRAAGEMVQTGVSAYEAQQAKNRAEADTKARLAKALQADVQWAEAEAVLAVALQGGNPQQIAAAQISAQVAQQSANLAGMGLPADAANKRSEYAQRAASEALNSSDPNRFARASAWQKVAAAAQMGGALFGGGGQFGGASLPSFLTRKFAGVPVWGWGSLVLVAGTATWLLLRRK